MMDFFNTSKKKLDIKNDNTELKNFNEENNKFTDSQNAIDAFAYPFSKIPIIGEIFKGNADAAKNYIDKDANLKEKINKEAERGGIEEEVNRFYNIKEPEKKYFKKLREEENKKRLKEQQMDKNITSPTSSLTKPVYLVFHGQTNEI
jgi:hypothetical protein